MFIHENNGRLRGYMAAEAAMDDTLPSADLATGESICEGCGAYSSAYLAPVA